MRYFVAVAEEGHFGRAADRVHVTQPAVSQQVRKLEDELGVRLLSRDRHRVELTDAGRSFLERVGPALAHLEVAARAAKRAGREEAKRLVFGFADTTLYRLSARVVRAFRERHPGVELALEETGHDQALRALRSGDVDVGLVCAPVLDGSGVLRVEEVLSEPLVAALPAGHPLARYDRVALPDLNGEPFVAHARRLNPALHARLTREYSELGLAPGLVQEASSEQAIVGLVGAGVGVALVHESLRAAAGVGVAYRPLVEPVPTVQTALVWRKDDASPLVLALLDVVRDAARAHGESIEPAHAS